MSSRETLEQFGSCWEGLEDPRSGNAALHDFHELLRIALCCVLCGGQGAVDMALFAEAKRAVSTRFSQPGQRPAQSRHLQPSVSQSRSGSISRFVSTFHGPVLETVAGRGGHRRQGCPALVRSRQRQERAAHGQRLGLGAAAGAGADRHRRQVQRDHGGAQAAEDELKSSRSSPLVEADHGRIETRTAMVSTEIGWLQKEHQWPGLQAIGKVVRVRETAYDLLSRPLAPERFNQVVRQHWSVENSLHWRLDVVMNEDQDRTRLGHGPHNLAVLPHMAINTMQTEGSKGSLRGKFKRAGWDNHFLYRLLALF